MAEEKYTAPIIQVGDTWLPGISKYDYKCADIDREGTTRSEAGVMHRDILRPRVVSAQVAHMVNSEDMYLITTLLAPAASIAMTVLCPSSPNATDGYVASEFYISEVNASLVWLDDAQLWWEVSYSLIEV